MRENDAMHRFAVKLQNCFVGYKNFPTFLGELVKTTKLVSHWLNLSFKTGELFVINSQMKGTGRNKSSAVFQNSLPGVVPDGVSDILAFDC